MRKLVLFMHTSLDGFAASPDGGLGWARIDETMFDFVNKLTHAADMALYGRVTYRMMEGYWPMAGNKPNASKHDIEHSKWYSQVAKVVLSSTMKGSRIANTQIIGDRIAEQITELKKQSGKNILIFGSPSASHALLQFNLVDEYWLFVNPILLGAGIPVFKNIATRTSLKLVESHVFASEVIALHYERIS